MIGVFIPDVYLIICKLVDETISPIRIPIKLLQLLRTVSSLHVIYYIDFLHFHLAEIDEISRRQRVHLENKGGLLNDIGFMKHTTIDDPIIMKQLKYFKHIHFELWEATQSLNTYLGWSLLAILLHSFIDFVYALLWFTNEMQLPWMMRKMIGK